MLNTQKNLFPLLLSTLLISACGGEGTKNNASLDFNNEVSIKENTTKSVLKLVDGTNNAYSLKIVGLDKDAFTLENGYLQFLELPDYEKKKSYHITIELYDGAKKITSKALTINIQDDPSDNSDTTPPLFQTETELNVPENRLEITTIVAQDDSGQITYAISGGEDADRFLIDPHTGKLTFNHFTPDYENPSDQDRDNHYKVEIAISDTASNLTSKLFTVEVINVDDTGNAANAKVLKTGLSDGPGGSSGFGDPRTVTEDGTGIVSIGNNGLFWEDTTHVNAEVTFDEAATYCSQLTIGGRNWRVPTRKELFELVNYGNYPSMYDNKPLHKNDGDFWTKTTLLEGRTYNGQNFEVSEKGWYISFRFGDDDFKDKTEKLHIRCVSGGTQFSTSGNFTESGDAIKDTLTGLEWENNSSAIAKHLTWHEAIQRCENLPGGTWRLPNINELHTLMPESGMDVLIYAKLAPELSIGPFWSSSTVPYNQEQAFYMENREYADEGCYDDDNTTICRYGDTQNNAVESKDLNGSIRSICVRGGRR